MKSINVLAEEIHQNAKSKGFYDEHLSKNVGEKLMLVVSELGEALEADRKNHHTMVNPDLIVNLEDGNEDFERLFRQNIKDTFEDELADALIRILDMAAWLRIDIESHVLAKMRYNSTREKMHGKLY